MPEGVATVYSQNFALSPGYRTVYFLLRHVVFIGREKLLEAKQRSADRTFTMVLKSFFFARQ